MPNFEPNKYPIRLMVYNWQQPDWPHFRYDVSETDNARYAFAEATGRVSGMLHGLTEGSQAEAIINNMVAEAIKTSEIEGEYMSRQDVASSIRNNLGLNKKPELIKNKKAQGIGKLMVDVRNTYAEPLTKEKLFLWHEMLMAGTPNILTGAWRAHEDPMQVISGALGKEKVHFEAPPSKQVAKEMSGFIKWFNSTAPGKKNEIKNAPVRAAVAHLYFESVHPFEDGNGRIGRALAEKALSQTSGKPLLLSLSSIIEANKKAYYEALQKASRDNDITKWIKYFTGIILLAQKQSVHLIDFTLKKAKFFDRFKEQLNDRQLKAIKKMMETGPKVFEGGMNANKYIAINKTSKATATRDLHIWQRPVHSSQKAAEGVQDMY